MGYYETTKSQFVHYYAEARRQSDTVAAATTSVKDLVNANLAEWYLHEDRVSGFAVSTQGELLYVFSLVKGRGDALVQVAIAHGAWHLDCFDGYLAEFYKRNGFVEDHRVPNWTPGGPDVVFLSIPLVSYMAGV